MIDLTNPIYSDENAAREHLESLQWPDGPVCPHCGSFDNITKLAGKSTRPGVYKCNACRKPFSVTVGTVFERSKIPLTKWLLATHLICASKKGMSAHQLHRMLGVTYKTAWFMAHRIREAMTNPKPDPIGGQNKVVEVDETYVGGKAANRKGKVPTKCAVVALVERDGEVRAAHVPTVNQKNVRKLVVTHASRQSYLMTDESRIYPKIGREFAGHGSVNHSIEEYVRGAFWSTNQAENFFSILKRGVNGVYHHWSEQHLDRYVSEFVFRYNARNVNDGERAALALQGIAGKRLTYRRTDEAANV